MTEMEKVAGQYMTQLHGNDLEEMFGKLVNENKGLMLAYNKYNLNKTKGSKEVLIRELSGVVSLITNIAHTLGVDLDTLNFSSISRVKRRIDYEIEKAKGPLTIGNRVRLIKVAKCGNITYRDGTFIRYVKVKGDFIPTDRYCTVCLDGNSSNTRVRESDLLRINR